VRRARPIGAGLLALLLLGAAACAGAGAAAPAGARRAPPGPMTPAFLRMRARLLDAQGAATTGGGAALRPLGAGIEETGLALVRATLPNDLDRADVPRFLEGRHVFGQALVAFARALDGADDAALPPALQALVDAYWGWVDAYKGLPPEHAV
jgi:hypothetical protein